jgi:hypothetical protein
MSINLSSDSLSTASSPIYVALAAISHLYTPLFHSGVLSVDPFLWTFQAHLRRPRCRLDYSRGGFISMDLPDCQARYRSSRTTLPLLAQRVYSIVHRIQITYSPQRHRHPIPTWVLIVAQSLILMDCPTH